jgi:hypothetical protein
MFPELLTPSQPSGVTSQVSGGNTAQTGTKLMNKRSATSAPNGAVTAREKMKCFRQELALDGEEWNVEGCGKQAALVGEMDYLHVVDALSLQPQKKSWL